MIVFKAEILSWPILSKIHPQYFDGQYFGMLTYDISSSGIMTNTFKDAPPHSAPDIFK
jgi:hypothetical protein